MSVQSRVAACFEFCCGGFDTTGIREQMESGRKGSHLHQHRQRGQRMGQKIPERVNYKQTWTELALADPDQKWTVYSNHSPTPTCMLRSLRAAGDLRSVIIRFPLHGY